MNELNENFGRLDVSESVLVKPEVVRIGQSFKLFSPERTSVTIPESDCKAYEGFPALESRVVVDTNGLLPHLPLEIYACAIYKNQSQAFTPFRPADGYQVTVEDYDGEARIAKRYKNSDNSEDIKSAPLVFGLYSDRDAWQALGILDENYRIIQQSFEDLNRLRLHVSFPNGLRFESRPQFNRFNTGNIEFFGGFYPVDARPLPVPTHNIYQMEEGLQIALPADPEMLQMIEGEFLLAI